MRKLILVTLFLFLTFTIAGSVSIEKGILDLRNHPVDLIPLNGTWEFYWHRILTNDFAPEKPLYVTVPGRWNYYSFTNFTADGYGTYRLRILKDKNDDIIYALNILNCEQSYRLFINGNLAASNGIVASSEKDYKPGRITRIIPLGSATNYEIVLQIASFRDQVGGIFQKIYFGKSEAIIRNHELAIGLDICVLSCILIMSLYHLFLFFYRRKETGFLYFALFAFLLSLRIGTLNNHVISWFFPNIDYYILNKMELWPIIGTPALIVLYLNYLYSGLTNKLFLKLLIGFGVLYSIIVLALPSRIYTNPILGYQYTLYLILGSSYSVIILFRAIRKKLPGSRTLLAGLLVFYISAMNDILYFYGISKLSEFSSFGLIIFIIFQAIHLAKLYSRTKTESLELKSSNIILEEMVSERTKALEEERNHLSIRNEQMEKDLFLARQIQLKYIPRKNPSKNIASFYKPMEMIGGDFFDFLEFQDKSHIGIFMSDVSGHGVPAAFVTSMIKSTMIQTASIQEKPNEILYELNNVLMNMSGGNFVTAIYGLYNKKSRQFTYANAGHNSPYYIHNGIVTQISSKNSGLPLAVVGNKDLKEINKGYTNQTVQLESGGKLIIYTDGLTESVSKDDPDLDFESSVLHQSIIEFQNLPAEAFVGELYLRLVDFHGSDSFSDDICLICVDIE